jgi:hypothetical protein
VREDERVVVDVDDPGLGRRPLGDLMVLSTVGRPVPMSRNWRTPASSARYRTTRPRK